MNQDPIIAPTDLLDYAKDRGWTLVKEASKDGIYVLNHPDFQGRQLVFPMDTEAPDCGEAIFLMIDKLAAMEGRNSDVIFEEVRRGLKSTEPHLEDIFPGTVERLDGEMGEDGRRSGEVILSILSPDGEQVRVRANLNADQYAQADKAHMSEGMFVMVSGILHPGRQPRQLGDIKRFELMHK